MQNIAINIINQSTNELPAYATTGSAGMDIRANLAGAGNTSIFGTYFNTNRVIY